MYYIDTPTAQIDALDFDPASGDVSQRRAVVKGFDFETTGFPDGWLGFVNIRKIHAFEHVLLAAGEQGQNDFQ